MAKKPDQSSGRSNKIKFVLVEADISDGNLSELTHAITSALRPTVVQVRQLKPQNGADALPPAIETDEEPLTENTVEEQDTADDAAESASSKPSKPRKSKQPQYDPSLFANAERCKEFKEFAAQKAPDNRSQCYLVGTYWLKEQGGSPTVNANKIYTCFKTAGWPMNFTDWMQTFHNLVHSSHLSKQGNGEFAITPLGEDSVLNPQK
ncbi:MAG: hypothetical protein WA020_03505 [Candidatus Acidiferrales bacterium]